MDVNTFQTDDKFCSLYSNLIASILYNQFDLIKRQYIKSKLSKSDTFNIRNK